MAKIHQTTMSLRFFGDDLDPEEITACLKHSPSFSARKGETWITKGGRDRVARTGSWRLTAPDRTPGDLDDQIVELFASLSDDVATWADLAGRFSGNLFCGLFMHEGNEGLTLSAETMKELAFRGLVLHLDIYGSLGED
jgi:hypothetical protein